MADHDGTLADRPAFDLASETVAFRLDVREHGLESVLGAAYLMTDRAYVRLGGDPGALAEVRLRARRAGGRAGRAPDRAGLEDLARDFLAELGTQRVRWTLAKSNRALRERVAALAVRKAEERG